MYIISIFSFFLFRVLFFVINYSKLGEATLREIFLGFVMGLRFDIVITGYLLAIPIFIISVLYFFKYSKKSINIILITLISLLYLVAFVVCGADIPFFEQFFQRFNIDALNWLKTSPEESAFVFKMIIQEKRFWIVIFPIIIMSTLFFFCLKYIFKKYKIDNSTNYFFKLTTTLLMFGLVFLGIRGRIDEKSPIRVGTAYFSNNAFINQLGLNPNFTFFQSYLDRNKEENVNREFINDTIAIHYIQESLNFIPISSDFPLARKIEFDTNTDKMNVVVILMESMSANKTKFGGNGKNLTPFLDSLIHESLFFENCYTTGTHTYCGLYGTLFSLPTAFTEHPFKRTPILKYNGIANVLKHSDYSTLYFTTHDSQFDNIGGFFLANDFEKIVSKSDYPSEQVKTTLGVPDDYMFEFAIPILNEEYKKEKPFFAAFLTSSDHGPYYIPSFFKPQSKDIKDQIVEYADFSLRKFFSLAKRQKWFNNTLFVFVADHGNSSDATYSIPVSYIHSPLLFFNKKLIEPSAKSDLASQMDIFPTIMGILKQKYVNNTLGIDLLAQKREYTVSTADDKYAVLDNEWLLIVNKDGAQGVQLYKYKEKNTENFAEKNPEIVMKMKLFGESNFQIHNFILKNNKQFYK